MSEFPNTGVTAAQLQQALRRDMPPFVNAVGRALDVGDREQRQLGDVSPGIWLGWAMANLSGDERVSVVYTEDPVVTSLPPTTRVLLGGTVEMRGEQVMDYRQGVLAERLRATHARNNPGSHRRIETISVTAARFVHTLGHVLRFNAPAWRDLVPMVPQTYLVPSAQGLAVKFTQQDVPQFPVQGSAETVVTYGPGMTGVLIAGETLDKVKDMHFVSGGLGARFVNEYTDLARNAMVLGMEDMRRSGQLARKLPRGVRVEDVAVPQAHYYENGIAKSIDRIANQTVDRGQPVDVVLMSSVHSAGSDEGVAGVAGAHRLLRSGGLLVVKAPEISIGNEGGMDVLTPVAARLFGAPAVAGECGTLHQYADPSLPEARRAEYAIYQK